ncbi:hypothetical protein M0L20_24750 [Spirosoma sp. RP8]|uniref:Uncharacterized protein n=1 Tax=Spirosoma liriopis TaxID=2937440 RepID=A0ABT0HSE9_9BACT|nr:hypothetical protein [Spirosoma liriopis]MCK8495105.1 hypothetical protein [Spirosoma liriopis]
MNQQQLLQTVASKLIERWRLVEAQGQNDSSGEASKTFHHQEGQFLEELIDLVNSGLTAPNSDWKTEKQPKAPPIYFSPDSTYVEPR